MCFTEDRFFNQEDQIMTLEDYLRKKTEDIASQVADNAPVDSCPHCNVCEGRLVYDGETFQYECCICGQRWSSECLEIDAEGDFLVVDYAD
jgi:hypothetical protein